MREAYQLFGGWMLKLLNEIEIGSELDENLMNMVRVWGKLGIFKSVRIDARITLSSYSFNFKLILNSIGWTLAWWILEVHKGMHSGRIWDLGIWFAQCEEKFWNFQKLVQCLATGYVLPNAIAEQSDILVLWSVEGSLGFLWINLMLNKWLGNHVDIDIGGWYT